MKTLALLVTWITVVVLLTGGEEVHQATTAASQPLSSAFGSDIEPDAARPAQRPLPLVLVENAGQFDPRIRFRSLLSPSVTFTDEGLLVTQIQADPAGGGRVCNVQFRFSSMLGSAAAFPPEPLEPSRARGSYFRGSDPTQWRPAVKCWQSVAFRDVVDGIDVEIHGRSGLPEYDVLAQPGAELDDLVLSVEGADRVDVTGGGGLRITTPLGIIEQQPAVVWQVESSGARTPLACSLEALGGMRFAFRVPEWNHARPLTIDPTLVWSTFVEGSQGDVGRAIAVDAGGCIYVAGDSSSADFPVTPGTFQILKSAPLLDLDAVVFKLEADGSTLDFATFLGAPSSSDYPHGLAVRSSGEVVITGETRSTSFPVTARAYSPTSHGGFETYVAVLDPSGSQLLGSTYFGGTRDDTPATLVLESDGSILIAGTSNSSDLPTTAGAAFTAKPSANPVDASAFVARLAPDGSDLQYCTYFGGSIAEQCFGLATDAEGNFYIAGSTYSGSGFPATPGAWQSVPGDGLDAYAAKFTPQGWLEWATPIGGPNSDRCYDLAVDAEGHCFITGSTMGGFPVTPGAAFAFYKGLADGFVAKLAPDGASLDYSTYLGGFGNDEPQTLAVAADGSCWIASTTASSNFPVTPDAFHSTQLKPNSTDAHLDWISASGSKLLYGTYYGGSLKKADFPCGMAITPADRLCITGYTLDSTFPVTGGSFDTQLNGSSGLFVVQFDMSPWSNLGHSLAEVGNDEAPVLAGSGSLQPGSSGALSLSGAAPMSACALIVGISVLDAPFKGGTMVPAPLLIIPAATDGAGQLVLAWLSWPSGLPAGTTLVLQGWIQDRAGPNGWTASNGVQGVTPVADS